MVPETAPSGFLKETSNFKERTYKIINENIWEWTYLVKLVTDGDLAESSSEFFFFSSSPCRVKKQTSIVLKKIASSCCLVARNSCAEVNRLIEL